MITRKTLQSKLVLSIVSIILIFGVTATILVYWQVRKGAVDNAVNDVEAIVKQQSKHTEETFNNGMMIIESVAKQKSILSYLKNESQEIQNPEILQKLRQFNIGGMFSAIYVLNSDGDTLVSTDPSFVGNNYSFRDYYKSSIKGEMFVDVSLGVTSNKLGYYFSVPIKSSEGLVHGVLVGKMIPDYIHQSIINTNIDENHKKDSMLVDRYGVIVFSDDEDDIYKSLGQLTTTQANQIIEEKRYEGIDIIAMQYNTVQNLVGNITETTSFELLDEVDDAKELISISAVGNFPFYIVYENDISVLLKQATTTVIYLGISLISIALLSILVVTWLVSKFLKPMIKLNEMAQKISRGNFDSHFDIRTGDEFEALGKSFNSMSKKIRSSYSNLEKSVKDKTKDLHDQQSALLNVLEDVEAEKEKSDSLAQEMRKFKLAVDNASDHIVITDPEGMILYSNKAVEKITGYTKEEILGTKAGDKGNWGGLMTEDIYKKLWKTIKTDKKVFQAVIKNKRKNGSEYDASASISPILNEKGEVVFFVGIERDVTKEKEIDRAKTEFVSLASHQLRTPLSTINWYSEMLLDGDVGKLNKEQTSYLKEVYKGNQRMVGLVNSLLNVSRLELGTFAIDPEEAKITDIAKSVINEMTPQIKAKKIDFKKKIDTTIPKMMLDVKLIRMVIQNLLSNAVKYTPEKGKVKIDILLNKKKKQVEISVADNGMGITESQQDKIFSKLFRADNVKETDTEGTGLGLYIVKSIVEHSGGKVWFDSVEKEGTTFYVTLPLKGMTKKTGSRELT